MQRKGGRDSEEIGVKVFCVIESQEPEKAFHTFIFNHRRFVNVLLGEIIADVLNGSQIINSEVLIPKKVIFGRFCCVIKVSLSRESIKKNFLVNSPEHDVFISNVSGSSGALGEI